MDIDNHSFYRGDQFTGDEDPRYSDREFILSQIQKIPFQYRKAVMDKYSQCYSETAKKSVNLARRECNTRLRAAVENISSKTHVPLSKY